MKDLSFNIHQCENINIRERTQYPRRIQISISYIHIGSIQMIISVAGWREWGGGDCVVNSEIKKQFPFLPAHLRSTSSCHVSTSPKSRRSRLGFNTAR
jgi:hypothetical protein